MILKLLLILAASHLTQADFKPCPEGSACLHHARCLTDANVLATTNPDDFDDWEKNCSGSNSYTELFVRPISNHKWTVTVYMKENVGISFGDSLIVKGNEMEATFKAGSDSAIKIRFNKEANKYVFTIEHPTEKLLEIFKNVDVIYKEEGMKAASSKKLPEFWAEIYRLTPCDMSLIVDDCTADAKDCTAPTIKADSVECKSGEHLWRKSDKPKWQKLTSISCDGVLKDWEMEPIESLKGRGTRQAKEEHSGNIEIRCAVNEPEAWTEVTTELPTDPKDVTTEGPTDPTKDSTDAPKEPTKDENHANSILHVLMVPTLLCIAFM